MQTPALFRALCTICPTTGSRTGCHYRTPSPKRHTMFVHTKCWILWAVICATGSTSIHFVKYSMAITRYFIYRTARGNEPRMSIPQVWNDHGLCIDRNSSGVHYASRPAVGTVFNDVHTSCSLPSWWVSSTPHEWPLMRELGRRCDSHISLRGVQPWCACIVHHLRTSGWGEYTHVWTNSHQPGYTYSNSSWLLWPLWAPAGVPHQTGSVYKVSSKFHLLQLGKRATILPLISYMRLFKVFSTFIESATSDFS